jgi:hypothetical protein
LEKSLLAALSSAVLFAGFAPYFRAALKGEVKPHAFSWFIWFFLTCIAAAAQLSEGAGIGAVPTAIAALTCLALSVIGFRQGMGGITGSDRWALAAAVATLPLWYVTSDPLWSVALICVIDAVGFYPTFRKSWRKPHEERVLAYFMFCISTVISIFALEKWNAVTLLFPLYLSAINISLTLYLLARRQAMKV